jgi:hypothetical protein
MEKLTTPFLTMRAIPDNIRARAMEISIDSKTDIHSNDVTRS